MGEAKLRTVIITLCEFCIAGKGGCCNEPGCALIRNMAPDIGIAEELIEDVDPREWFRFRHGHYPEDGGLRPARSDGE